MQRSGTDDQIMEASLDAVCSQLHRQTCIYQVCSSSGVTGSGVMVRLGDKLLVATVGHTLRDCDSVEICGCPAKGIPVIRAIVTGRKHIEGKLDIGILEVPSEFAHLVEDYIHESRISPDLSLSDGQLLIVAGYPDDAQVSLASSTNLAVCNTLHAPILPHSQWPDNLSPMPDRNESFLLKYPEVGTRSVCGPHGPVQPGVVSSAYPKPRGLSGGGIWYPYITESPETGLQVPSARLLGIQASMYEKKRLLRGVHIRKWLEYVDDIYPNLRKKGSR